MRPHPPYACRYPPRFLIISCLYFPCNSLHFCRQLSHHYTTHFLLLHPRRNATQRNATRHTHAYQTQIPTQHFDKSMGFSCRLSHIRHSPILTLLPSSAHQQSDLDVLSFQICVRMVLVDHPVVVPDRAISTRCAPTATSHPPPSPPRLLLPCPAHSYIHHSLFHASLFPWLLLIHLNPFRFTALLSSPDPLLFRSLLLSAFLFSIIVSAGRCVCNLCPNSDQCSVQSPHLFCCLSFCCLSLPI